MEFSRNPLIYVMQLIHQSMESVEFDEDLIRRYDVPGPRYTSYPTAAQFSERFGARQYINTVNDSNEDFIPKPLSLYFHIPFCSTVCYYCACNKVVTKNRKHAETYLDHLKSEIKQQGKLMARDRKVDQLHWGGGTPTFLNHDQIADLMEETRKYFTLRNDDRGEYSVEIDPREANKQTIALLRELGFNRMSVGVQDFDPKVQKAVNRIQSEEQTSEIMDAARKEGFKSISIDLIYGLPHQTVESFSLTLDKIIKIQPDRLSVFNYAHMPHRFKTQKQINEADLPSAPDKLKILKQTITQLTDAGYVYIGMDHFSKPDDELARAQKAYTLSRNFQGYSTHADCDLIGLGATAISKVRDTYSQNVHDLESYYRKIEHDGIAIERGIALNDDDILRREVIHQLICHFELDIEDIEYGYRVSFRDYFARELKQLEEMERDGLVFIDDKIIRILPKGRLLVRNICMVFDRYTKPGTGAASFSKTI
ncbi:MAG: oxygen-independent coproporphyrinogen III oxidase [Gammaproteobacteria bacterium]|nr:MAG: oxygen-independent coproporphyrinogen III oxidase [Gammaproteobacteria bacterium]